MDAGDKSGLDVLLVAARKDRIDDRAGVIAQSGRRPVVIDVEAFALANAYQMNYPERTDPLTALMHVGRNVTLVCLLERGEPIFTRDISAGGQAHLEALLKEFGPIGVDELAARRMLHGQYPADVNADQAAGRPPRRQRAARARRSGRPWTSTRRPRRSTVSAGSCCRAARGRPWAWWICWRANSARRWTCSIRSGGSRARIGAAGADGVGPSYAVAVGLAMRKEGDR